MRSDSMSLTGCSPGHDGDNDVFEPGRGLSDDC